MEEHFYCYSEAFGKSWEPDAFTAILGVTSDLTCVNKYEQIAIHFGMAIARKLIVRQSGGEKKTALTFELWMGRIVNMLHLERLRLLGDMRLNIFERSRHFNGIFEWGKSVCCVCVCICLCLYWEILKEIKRGKGICLNKNAEIYIQCRK